MLWPFSHFRKPRIAPAGTIETIYGMIVTRAREPVFYRDWGVPDSVGGRFDLLLLHLWIVLRHLRTLPNGTDLAQALFDHFCADMDANLREMGIGDLAVPKKMQAFGEAFYGRAAAYDMALADSSEALAQAISRNILDGQPSDGANRMAAYVQAAIASLDHERDARRLGAGWTFPALLAEETPP